MAAKRDSESIFLFYVLFSFNLRTSHDLGMGMVFEQSADWPNAAFQTYQTREILGGTHWKEIKQRKEIQPVGKTTSKQDNEQAKQLASYAANVPRCMQTTQAIKTLQEKLCGLLKPDASRETVWSVDSQRMRLKLVKEQSYRFLTCKNSIGWATHFFAFLFENAYPG